LRDQRSRLVSRRGGSGKLAEFRDGDNNEPWEIISPDIYGRKCPLFNVNRMRVDRYTDYRPLIVVSYSGSDFVILWQVPLGSKALGLFWGLPNLGGPIVTASGLVFIAAAIDDKLRAFDVRTREPLCRKADDQARATRP
jgi:hypothetical protein